MNKRIKVGSVVIVALLLIGIGAWWMGERDAPGNAPAHVAPGAQKGGAVNGVVQDGSGKQVLYWHDPMAPEHKFNEPGKSPFMDMPLVPRYAGDADGEGVRVSPNVMQSLGMRVGKAEITMQKAPLVAVGRVAFDEHQVQAIQTRTAGFVERLYVRAEGDPVKAGQKIADIYSPELFAAQHELVALTRVTALPDIEAVRAAARERLRLLGMDGAEIRSVERAAVPRRSVGVYAPFAGVVRELGLREGAQVMPGQTIVQLAQLSRLWVLAELTERESGRVRKGQPARIHVDAIGNGSFNGVVDYVYPQLDAASRTTRVRVEVRNDQGLLRPGMYAQAEFNTGQREVLTVPSEAVIATGVRKVVLRVENGGFVPVEVETAEEAGGRTEVRSGLRAGDEVVLSGQFLIDSEASLNGVLARLTSSAAMSEPTPAHPPGTTESVNAAQATATSRGTVEEVAPARGVVTLSHGPIPALQWPAMTMSFKLRDAKSAERLHPGATVIFEVKIEPEAGEYVIESIQAVSGSGQ